MRVLFILMMTLFIAGCAPFMVSLYEVDDVHLFDGAFTKDQVKEAIIEGADFAGWRAKDVGNDTILVSYLVRIHTVDVEIDYSESFYVTRYKSSSGMKMFCTEKEKIKYRNMIVSGQQDCPGLRKPAYIHKGYKEWMDSLNAAIQNSLARM